MPTLSESRSRLLVSEAGIPVSNWETADSTQEAVSLARNLGFPVVIKLCGDEIAHKTERGLVRLNLNTEEAVEIAADELFSSDSFPDAFAFFSHKGARGMRDPSVFGKFSDAGQ